MSVESGTLEPGGGHWGQVSSPQILHSAPFSQKSALFSMQSLRNSAI